MKLILMWLACLTLSLPTLASEQDTIVVGCKPFTESYVLAELIAQTLEKTGEAKVERKFGLSGSGLTFSALLSGKIDIYPEYTGTIALTLLKQGKHLDYAEVRRLAAERKLVMSHPLGFNNTYAIAMKRSRAEELGLKNLSDLHRYPNLRFTVSHEFVERPDGLKAMLKYYGLPHRKIQGMEHALSYKMIDEDKTDIIDAYATDAKLKKLDLVVLNDDRKFFPQYEGVWLARQTVPMRFPRSWEALAALEGKLSNESMIDLNSMVDLDQKKAGVAAASFLGSTSAQTRKPWLTRQWQTIRKPTGEHLLLVFVPLLLVILLGVPLGILCARMRSLQQPILAIVGIFQTIPSLALFIFLIPYFDKTKNMVIVALVLYGLLPVVRNTLTGIASIDKSLLESCETLGLHGWQRLLKIEIPLASVQILAGIKTTAIMNVGIATIAAFVGAGGYGTLIVSGLTRYDTAIMLQGAIPAALMAILVQLLFEWFDKILVPQGLKLTAQNV